MGWFKNAIFVTFVFLTWYWLDGLDADVCELRERVRGLESDDEYDCESDESGYDTVH